MTINIIRQTQACNVIFWFSIKIIIKKCKHIWRSHVLAGQFNTLLWEGSFPGVVVYSGIPQFLLPPLSAAQDRELFP